MLVLFVSVILLVLILYLRNYTYWMRRNVKCELPIPLFGNHYEVLLGLRSDTEKFTQLYEKYKNEKVIGYYRGSTPELIIRDPGIIKNILNVDFLNFHWRGAGRDPKIEPLMLNVFSIDGDLWKLLRHNLSSAFTSNKIRNMFPLIVKCTDKLQDVAHELATNDKDVNAVDLMVRFTMEFIGACGFGLEMNTINVEKSLFLKLKEMIFTKSKKQMVLLALRQLFPKINFLKQFPISDGEIKSTILDIMKIVREQRNNKPVGRNDFVDILLELENKKIIQEDSLDMKDQNGFPKKIEVEMSPILSAAQLFIFFAAGFETAATATSCTIHNLAFHPEIQSKVHEEIDSVLSKYDNKICYDSVTKMSYLEMVFKESMRIFSPGGCTTRICLKNYTIPELNLTIEAGTRLIIPIQSLQMDAKYYDNPTEFRPERFSQESIEKRNKYVYIPFGEGPRKCLGERLGLIESLAGLVALLQKFIIKPTSSSEKEFKRKKTAYIVQAVEGALPVKLILRNKTNSKLC
ncbi:cytochrome P450 6B5-like [Battus philenor]|uniref:cytochrome P450 6B5-like n=1 Tax=Battus philenor TaxID=42288 RepID=UPI0035CF9996